jgi:hypothetical protein
MSQEVVWAATACSGGEATRIGRNGHAALRKAPQDLEDTNEAESRYTSESGVKIE